jgi:hypothetical protein
MLKQISSSAFDREGVKILGELNKDGKIFVNLNTSFNSFNQSLNSFNYNNKTVYESNYNMMPEIKHK